MKQSKMPAGTVIILIFAAIFIIVAMSLMLRACSRDPLTPRPKSYNSAFSSAAIGHKGLYEMLRLMQLPVERAMAEALATTGSHGTLIMAEPSLHLVDNITQLKLMTAPRLLLVLPKWLGDGDAKNRQWIELARLQSLDQVREILDLAIDAEQASVFRYPWQPEWVINEIGFKPTINNGIQLISSEHIRPLVATETGILLGEVRDGERLIWILADPDVMNNHGLGKGDNAAFMFTLIDKLRYWQNDDPNAPLVFDETIHGYFERAKGKSSSRQQLPKPTRGDTPETIFDMLFRVPFVIVTILTVLAAIMLFLCALRRFGAPATPKPSLDYGKAQLINNGARLLDYSGHQAEILRRYVRMTVRSVGQSLHAPRNLSEKGLAAWLDQVGKARQVRTSCSDIMRTMSYLNTNDNLDLTRLFETARQIHRWKGEMLNGSTTNRRHR